tara:strand:- start:504 stop:638 length:135 start_codon:yes stop_codon:yes gene_type:complete
MSFMDGVSISAGLCAVGHFTFKAISWCFYEKDEIYSKLDEEGVL